uniref:Dynein regulatory complex subunit 2 n=1 Tax=Phlebotomus papatasi TaxID=29031 RepID=A0A1B0CZ04_PHLPP
MGKKKKGGNKLARMSEEERARYLQHRADMEEEARRRKETLIALYMKNKLKREDAFTRLNMAKINQEWRSILRQLKCEELKEEIKCVEVFCGDSIEHKNQVIRRLLCDLDESEELYSTMLHAHVENIERIISEIAPGSMSRVHVIDLTLFPHSSSLRTSQVLARVVRDGEAIDAGPFPWANGTLP